VFRQGVCGEPSFNVQAEGLKIPMSLWAILEGRGRVGHVSVSKIKVILQKSSCDESTAERVQPSSSQEAVAQQDTETIKSLGLRSIYDDLYRRGEGISLDEISVENEITPDWSMVVKDLKLEV